MRHSSAFADSIAHRSLCSRCRTSQWNRRAAVALLPSFIVIGGFPLLFMAVLNMPDAVTGGLIGIQLASAFFLGILIRYLYQLYCTKGDLV